MNMVSKITNFFKITNAVKNTTKIENFNCGDNSNTEEVDILTYDCGYSYIDSRDNLANNFTDNLYKKVFTDSLKYNNILGVSQELIDSGIFFKYCLDFVKSNNDYKLYIKKSNNNEIIAINTIKIDNTFIELEIKKEYQDNKYELTVLAFKLLSNHILAVMKNSEISNFLVFKKNGYNSSFDMNGNVGSEEAKFNVEVKSNLMQEQLTNIQRVLLDSSKQSILMIDKEDSIENIKNGYADNEKVLDGIYREISLITGLPPAYLGDKLASSLSGNHSGELQIIKDSIFNFFKAEILPFLNTLGIKNNEKEQINQFIKINSMLELIKDLPDVTKQNIITSSGLELDIINYYKGVK